MTTKPIKEKPKPELPASKISKEKSAQKAEKAEKTPPKGPPKGPQIKTLGPVSDLGKYVTRDWWKRIFDAYYLKTDGDVVNDANITSTEVNLFSNVLELKPEFRVLDLCCGQGRHTLELARRGYKSLYGLDQSHYLIQRAKSQARKENLHVNFQKGDARKIPYPVDYFDTVMKPRIQKIVYSKDWKDGKPTTRDTGISHCFKYIRLESYEDALNNLRFDENSAREKALTSNKDSIFQILKCFPNLPMI